MVKTLIGGGTSLWRLAFSPDGQRIAVGSGDGTIKVWKLDGTLERSFQGHSATVWIVAFSPDGKTIASGSGDATVKLWKLDGDPDRSSYEGNPPKETAVLQEGLPRVGSGDSEALASLRPRGDAKGERASPRRGTLLKTFTGHTAAVWGISFSPDGKTIASGSVDNMVKLWKLDGTELATLRGHSSAVRSVEFSHDGTILASVGEDSKLILCNWQRILKLDLLAQGCDIVRDYLRTNAAVESSDTKGAADAGRHLCQ